MKATMKKIVIYLFILTIIINPIITYACIIVVEGVYQGLDDKTFAKDAPSQI